MIWDQFSSTYVDGRCFVAVTYPFNRHDALLVENLHVDEMISYIKHQNITKAYIQNFAELNFLQDCPSLQHIAIELRIPFQNYSQLRAKSKIAYDFSPLAEMSNLVSLDLRDNERPGSKAVGCLDISKLISLQQYSGEYKFVKNLSLGTQLKTLRLIRYDKFDISEISNLKQIDTLHFSFSKLHTLGGCGELPQLQCLYLHNNRLLSDISDLKYCSKSLRALRIENCSNIQDYSALYSLSNLELLEISGNGSIPSLHFVDMMPNLKTLVFSINVEDGDLSPCDHLQWVYSEKNKRHYNRKDADLPKIKYHRGNENIIEWRRLE